jgi:hypothetical protein
MSVAKENARNLKCSNSKSNEQKRKSKVGRMAKPAIVLGADHATHPWPSGQVARSREPSDTVLTEPEQELKEWMR